MRHATLSAFLLVGFGLYPFMGMLGGGDVNYGKDPTVQQSTGDTGNMESKGTVGGSPRQKTTANQAAELCKNPDENTCSDHNAKRTE